MTYSSQGRRALVSLTEYSTVLPKYPNGALNLFHPDFYPAAATRFFEVTGIVISADWARRNFQHIAETLLLSEIEIHIGK